MSVTQGFQDSFARSVALLFNAPFIAVAAFAYIYQQMRIFVPWSLFVLPAFFSGLLPLLLLTYLRHTGRIGDMMVNNRDDRLIPFAGVFGSYLLGVLALRIFNAPPTIVALMLSYVITSLAMVFITLRWKISIHAAGVAGPSMFLVLRYHLILWPFLLTTLLVCWSRWRLRVHTIEQLFAGAILSVIVATIMVSMLSFG